MYTFREDGLGRMAFLENPFWIPIPLNAFTISARKAEPQMPERAAADFWSCMIAGMNRTAL